MLKPARSGGAVRRALLLLVTLLAAALAARLGFWQLDRARQKLDLQDRIRARAEQPALAQADLARQADAAPAQHYRRITLRGRWLAQHTVYLDNRQMNGRPGFFVLTPLLLADQPGQKAPADAVLVQRGWVPRDFVDRSRLPPLATPTTEVSVPGRIAPPPSKLFEFSGADTGPIRQNLDLEALAREIGVRLRPLSVQQTAAEAADAPDHEAAAGQGASTDDNLLRQWPAPAVDVGKHHGYAFQWFALCALITGLFLWFQLLRPRFAPPDGRST